MKRPLSPSLEIATHETVESDLYQQCKKKKVCHSLSSGTTKRRVTFADESLLLSEYDLFSLDLPSLPESTGTTAPLHTEGCPSMFETLTLEDIERLWYCENDMVAAKELTRALLMGTAQETPEVESETGLGLRKYSAERSQYKRSALWHIMAATRDPSKNPEFVRAVSERCSWWSRQVAYGEGLSLHADIYGSSSSSSSSS